MDKSEDGRGMILTSRQMESETLDFHFTTVTVKMIGKESLRVATACTLMRSFAATLLANISSVMEETSTRIANAK